MNWSFEISFLVFLFIIFISQTIATKLGSLIPMPLILGVLSVIGFATNLLPRDFIEKSNMIIVGTIAYNLFVVNSGTMINLKLLKMHWKDSLICIVSSLAIFIVVGIGLSGVIGRELAILSSGSVIGGGATCAIASFMVMGIKPELAVYPWLIFMFQGIFAVPIITFALKKEAKISLESFRKQHVDVSVRNESAFGNSDLKQGLTLSQKIQPRYKTTAYYLVLIMGINVLNKYIHLKFNIGINSNATALIAGFVFSQIGLIDVAALHKSDSFGLLLLGLMGLMVNTLSKNSIGNIIRLLKPMMIMFIVSVAVLILIAIILSKLYKLSPYGRIAMNLNCLMGFPVNQLLIEKSLIIGETKEEKEYLNMKLSPLLNIATMLISNTISIIIAAITINYI